MILKSRGALKASLPYRDYIVYDYFFDEGAEPTGSMNNIIVNNIVPLSLGNDIVANGTFSGTYVSGVAPFWAIDASVTATEDTSVSPSAQRLTNCNGITQGMHPTASPSVTSGGQYKVVFSLKLNSGSGTIQIQLPGVKSSTYSIDTSILSTSVFTDFYYYVNMKDASTSTNIVITASATTIDFSIKEMHIYQISGSANHMIMDFDLYDMANRYQYYYDFNGTDHNFFISDLVQSNLDFGSKFSVAVIADFRGAGNGNAVSKFERTTNQRGFVYRYAPGGQCLLLVSSNGTVQETISTALYPTSTQFHFSGIVFDTGVGQFYVNGSSVTTTHSVGPPLTTTSIFNNTAKGTIGSQWSSSIAPEGYFTGKLGRIILWKDIALNSDEMNYVYNLARANYGI